MQRESINSTLPAARLRRAGVTGADASTWAMRAGAAALLFGVAVASWAMLRPLPSPKLDESTAVTRIPRNAAPLVSLADRESLLADVAGAGNIFAPDREPWRQAVAQRPGTSSETDPEDTASSEDDPATVAANLAAANAKPGAATSLTPFDAIPITESPPVAIQKDLKDLRLRGVYRTKSGPVALIGNVKDQNKNGAKPRRVGETFGEEEWAVLAIDDIGKRVILSRADLNVQLAMYTLAAEAAQVTTQANGSAIPVLKPSVIVMSMTPEQLRRELTEAGVSPAEIEELLALAAQEDAPVVAAATEDAAPEAIPAAPDGLAELLKMMSTNSGPGETGGGGRAKQFRPDRSKPPS